MLQLPLFSGVPNSLNAPCALEGVNQPFSWWWTIIASHRHPKVNH